MSEDIKEIINKKIIHIKARPTYENINYVINLLKTNGYITPKFSSLAKFCNDVNKLEKEEKIKENNKENIVCTFEEIDYLPNLLEEKEEEKYNDDDSLTNSESDEIEENDADAEEADVEKNNIDEELEIEEADEYEDDEYYEDEDKESEFSE
jgi:hypothetical protein